LCWVVVNDAASVALFDQSGLMYIKARLSDE